MKTNNRGIAAAKLAIPTTVVHGGSMYWWLSKAGGTGSEQKA
jgi:hypothetical protein